MKGLILSILAGLRGKIPSLTAMLFMGLCGLLYLSSNIRMNLEFALIGSTVAGYVVGLGIKSLIPDPEKVAL